MAPDKLEKCSRFVTQYDFYYFSLRNLTILTNTVSYLGQG